MANRVWSWDTLYRGCLAHRQAKGSMTSCHGEALIVAAIVPRFDGAITLRLITLIFCACFCAQAVADDAWQQAVSLYDDGKLEQAQKEFENLNRNDPKHAETFYYLGLVQQSRGEYLEAGKLYDQAIELDDKQSKFHLGRGQAYGSAAGNASFFKQMRLAGKIKSSFERAVELDADNVDARSGLIVYYLNAPGIAGGSEEKAEQQAIEIGKRDVFRGHLAMANIYQAQENDQAVEQYVRGCPSDC